MQLALELILQCKSQNFSVGITYLWEETYTKRDKKSHSKKIHGRPGSQLGIFQDRGGKGISIYLSFTTQKKNTLQAKILVFYLQVVLKTAFKMRHLTHRGHNPGIFFQFRALISIFKSGQGRSIPPLASCTSASILLLSFNENWPNFCLKFLLLHQIEKLPSLKSFSRQKTP